MMRMQGFNVLKINNLAAFFTLTLVGYLLTKLMVFD